MSLKEQKYNRKQIDAKNLTPQMIDYLLEIGVRRFQESQSITVDGMAGLLTQQRLNFLNNVTNKIPEGKGIYIRTLKNLGTPEELVQKALWAGLDFVVIGSIWQDKLAGIIRNKRFNKKEDLKKYSKAFRDAGIKVWVWGYPAPGREDIFIQAIIEDALTVQALGVILDPEILYRKKSEAAQFLVQKLKPVLIQNNLSVGITSYGSVWYFKDFPYKEFAEIGGFGSPQVYDNNNNLPPNHAHKAYDAYKKAGFKIVAMSGPAYNKTKQQLRKLLLTFPPESTAIIFWDWSNLKLKSNAPLWDVIREYKL